jgi:hypothetical protein
MHFWQADLEVEMKLLKLDTQGNKQELVERLHAYLSAEQVSTAPSKTLTWLQCACKESCRG